MRNLKKIFIDIFSSARDSGLRAFVSLIKSDSKILAVNREMYPMEMGVYENITKEEREKFEILLRFFMQWSFVALMEKLELGDGDISFSVTAHDDASGEIAALINAENDLGLRNEFDDSLKEKRVQF